MQRIRFSFQMLMKIEFARPIWSYLKLVHHISWKSVQWDPSCIIQAERYDDANSHFSQYCESARHSQFLVRMHSDRQKERRSIDETWIYQRQEDETNLDGFMMLLVIFFFFRFKSKFWILELDHTLNAQLSLPSVSRTSSVPYSIITFLYIIFTGHKLSFHTVIFCISI